MIMISAVISLSHLRLFGYWNVLWNASINTKQNERNGNWCLSLCPTSFPQDVTLMRWKCRTPTASITELNSAVLIFLSPHGCRRKRTLCFTLDLNVRLTRPQQRQIFGLAWLLTPRRPAKMKAVTTIQLYNTYQQTDSLKDFSLEHFGQENVSCSLVHSVFLVLKYARNSVTLQ